MNDRTFRKLMGDPAKAAKSFSEKMGATGIPKDKLDGFKRLLMNWDPKKESDIKMRDDALDNIQDRIELVFGVKGDDKSPADMIAVTEKGLEAETEETVDKLDEQANAELDQRATEMMEPIVERLRQIGEDQIVTDDPAKLSELNEEHGKENVHLAPARPFDPAVDAAEPTLLTAEERAQVWETRAQAASAAVGRDVTEKVSRNLKADYYGNHTKGSRVCARCGITEKETLAENDRYSFVKITSSEVKGENGETIRLDEPATFMGCVHCYSKTRSKKAPKSMTLEQIDAELLKLNEMRTALIKHLAENNKGKSEQAVDMQSETDHSTSESSVQ